jgi:hypothetical protein
VKTAHLKIRRLFTYGTPHGGIHFRSGLGWGEKVRDLFGPNESDTFGPKRMRQFLNMPEAADDELHHLGSSTFPAERCFSLVGTNFHDYEVTASKISVGPGSDGLVMTRHAFIKNSNRAYIHRAHSGPFGLVNSEEGYQNLQRFLFGDTAVKVSLTGLAINRAALKLPPRVTLGSLLLETKVSIRGLPIIVHRHVKEEGSALPVSARDLLAGETLFRTFLMRGKRPTPASEWSRFQIELRIVPVFVKDRRVFSDDSFEGEALYQATIQIGVSDPLQGGARKVEWSWGAFGREVKEATLPPGTNGTNQIPLPLGDGSAISSGQLAFEIKPW